MTLDLVPVQTRDGQQVIDAYGRPLFYADGSFWVRESGYGGGGRDEGFHANGVPLAQLEWK